MKKQLLTGLFLVTFLLLSANCMAGERDIYQLRVYTISSEIQEKRMDSYLENALLPALHRADIKHVGVFKPRTGSELEGTRIFVLIPCKDFRQLVELEEKLLNDQLYQEAGSDYVNAPHDDPPYARIESTILKAFRAMPEYSVPTHSTQTSERVYELRSYQAATEKKYQKKVEMFCEGGETQLFVDLGFQPIFFGEVISGPEMPNLIYLTTFENIASQEKHWDAFRTSPVWDKLKNDKQYANTVSHIDKHLLYPTEYSDL